LSARHAVTLAAALLAWGPTPPRAQEALRVCLNQDLPPYSVHRAQGGSGFDLAVAAAAAERLGRTLAVQWFESKLDEGTSMALEANALLSDGRCQLAASYPLVRAALGKPGLETTRLPDFEGAGAADRRRRVALGTLVASRPYHRALLTVVLGRAAAGRPVASLADLRDLRLGVEGGTFADAILMLFDNGRLIDRITHVVAGRGELLPRLEQGDYDAVLVELRRLDAYRAEHPDTRLTPSGYHHRIGFNLGFVALDPVLIGKVDQALDAMLDRGEIEALARAAGMTPVRPQPPPILEDFSLADLRK